MKVFLIGGSFHVCLQAMDSIPVIMKNRDIEGISISVEADDFDDHVLNGPPFSFEMDPSADQDIRDKFEVTTDGE